MVGARGSDGGASGRWSFGRVVTLVGLTVAGFTAVSYHSGALFTGTSDKESELSEALALDAAVAAASPHRTWAGGISSGNGKLKVTVHRKGYPTVAKDARRLYGWDLIAEPKAPNVFKVTNTPSDSGDSSYVYTWTLDHLEGPSADVFTPIRMEQTDSEVHINLPSAADRFLLTVTEYDADSLTQTRSYTTETLVCKYVRREINTLSDKDRNHYLNALHTMYTTTLEDGQAKYGHEFINHAHLVALHATKKFKYHATTSFLTSHPMFVLKVERSLLAIDDTLVLPYWDFFKDAEREGDWADSNVYKEDWFGTIHNGPEDKYRITGRFRDVQVVYDPDDSKFPRAAHGPYGYLRMGDGQTVYLQRTSYNCGFYHKQGFSSCSNLERCMENFASGNLTGLYEFDNCIEDQVHGTLHGMHGGLWDCQVDLGEYLEENSDWMDEGRMSFMALNAMVCQDLLTDSWLACDTDCVDDDGDDDFCGCYSAADDVDISAPGDIDRLTGDEVYKLIRVCLHDFYVTEFRGKVYMKKNTQGRYVWKDLSHEQTDDLNRLLLKTAMFSRDISTFNSGSAPNDPLFFIMHQIFDRALHVARLSPYYNKANFEWLPLYHEMGEGFLSLTPFSSELFQPYLGDHLMNKDGEPTKMTNKEIWAALKPDSLSMPYVYEELRTFGSCTLMGSEDADDDSNLE